MIRTLDVKHFQSLHDVELELSPFTVIVGPSSSGKSALTRAVKTLAGNARGTAFIEHGQREAMIVATNDTARVALTRSAGTNNEYRVDPVGDEGPQEARYTKLGGTTPPEVSKALRLEPDASQWYASQFDKPYLLADSGGEVARTLGALTNVSVIFEAAREANRQRQAAGTTLKTRQSDVAIVKERAEAFKTLAEREAAVSSAEAALEVIINAEGRRSRLIKEWERLVMAATALKSARATLVRTADGLDEALAAITKAQNLTHAWQTLRDDANALVDARERHEQSAKGLSDAEEEYQRMLHEMGTCPTCGQTV